MKAVVSQSDLNQALKVLARNYDKRAKGPVLFNVLLTADAAAGKLVATVYDLGNNSGFIKQVSIDIAASVETPGSITASVTTLKDIVNGMPKTSAVILSFDPGDSDGKLLVSSDKGAAVKINTIPADDFPNLPLTASSNTTDKVTFGMQPAEFVSGLGNVLFSASSDTAKVLLTGINLQLAGNSLSFASTDGHRLSVLTLDDIVDTGETEFNFTMPAKILAEIAKIIGAKPKFSPVSFTVSKQDVTVVYGNYKVQFRLLDGQYPNYRQLIPDNFKSVAVFDRLSLLRTLEQAAVVANAHYNVVKFEFTEVGATISADANGLMQFNEDLPIISDSPEITISFNVRYLIEVLKTKAMGADKVQIQMNAPTTPAIMFPVGTGDVPTGKYTYLVMPVQIRKRHTC
jgi:DNA polymerase-3 subunit beta